MVTDNIQLLIMMMPEMDGLETLKRIRQRSERPVIMLTALEDEPDRILGLEMGADDYVHKPINPRELLARIKTILRRPRTGGTPATSDGFSMDTARLKLIIDGRPVDLTRVEFDILRVLVQAVGRIRKKIETDPAKPKRIKTVWGKGYKWDGESI